MEIFNVLAAAAASFFFGALWYMVLSGPWMAASGVAQGADGKPLNAAKRSICLVLSIASSLLRRFRSSIKTFG